MMAPLHPWPTAAGIAQDGTTSVELRGGGSVRWSAEVGQRLATEIVTDAHERWFARSEGGIVAGVRDSVLWRRAATVLAPSLLSDGLLALPAPDPGLAVVTPAEGVEVWSIHGYYWATTPRAGGGVAAIRQVQADWSLVILEAGGFVRWSRPVGMPVAAPLVLVDDTVVSVSRERIEAFDTRGQPLWSVSPDGFAGPIGKGRFTTQAVPIDGERILVGVDGHDWLGYVIVDPVARTTARWPQEGDRATPAAPLAVRRNPVLALVTWLQHTMLVNSFDGSERGATQLPAEPYAYAVDPPGRIAVAYTLDTEYHDRYLWHDHGRALRGLSGVALFEPDGRHRWTWNAPGPLGAFAVSAAGEILVTSEGRLWAIG